MILRLANQIPPYVCRILARKANGQKPMSSAEIAERSGLSRAHVSKLSKAQTWSTVTMDVADRFATACGVDLAKPNRTLKWMRSATLVHLRRGGAKQRQLFHQLLSAGGRE